MPDDELVEPLDYAVARQLMRTIIDAGNLSLSRHARSRMAERNMDMADVINVLRGGFVREHSYENGTYRYRFETPRMVVMAAFRSGALGRVVSVWRRS